MGRYEQYLICKERGHVGSTITTFGIPNSPIFKTCKYCGTTFWTTTEVTHHEKNAPEQEGDNDE